MKSYKLVNSLEIREKISRIYNVEVDKGKQIDEMIFILVDFDGRLHYTKGIKPYLESHHEEITQKDFLALPEPLKAGDWVKVNNEYMKGVFCVSNVSSNFINLESFHNNYNPDVFTKLTQNQIEVLCLE